MPNAKSIDSVPAGEKFMAGEVSMMVELVRLRGDGADAGNFAGARKGRHRTHPRRRPAGAALR